MGSTIKEQLWYGDHWIDVDLPERTRVLRANGHSSAKPVANLEASIREAIANPIAHDPIHKLVGKGAKVTIAFDDPGGVQTKGVDFRQVAISVLLEELQKAGVELSDILLLCANALHRKWTRSELAPIVGERISVLWPAQRLRCHDAENPDELIFLGETHRGFEVEVNRAVTDSDLLIYLNITHIPFGGGWKSVAVGLGTFRSIRHHHRPFPFASGKSVMDPKISSFHKLVWEQGKVIEDHLAKKGRRIFSIESVVTATEPPEVTAVFAGHTPDVHNHTLDALSSLQVLDVDGQSDIGLYGVTSKTGYAHNSFINPLLVTDQGFEYTYSMFQNQPLIRPGGIIILSHPCKNQFDDIHHPSYREFYERLLPMTLDPYELWNLFSDDFAHRPEFIHKYRYGYGYHGAHPFFMWNTRGAPSRHLSGMFLAGATDFDVARQMGFEPFHTVEDAIAEAENRLGKDASISFHKSPPTSIARVNGTNGAH